MFGRRVEGSATCPVHEIRARRRRLLPLLEAIEIIRQSRLLVELRKLRAGFGRVELTTGGGFADDPVLVEDREDRIEPALSIGAGLARGRAGERQLVGQRLRGLLRGFLSARLPRPVVLFPE